MLTALAAPSMTSPPHDAVGKCSPKSDDPLVNGPEGSETEVKGEIDHRLKIRQVRTRQPSLKMAKIYNRASLQRFELPFTAKGIAMGF